METCVLAKFLRWNGFGLVALASIGWIFFDIQFGNSLIGEIFFKDLRKGIEKLSSLNETNKHRTLSDHENRESYYALLKVVKRNAKNVDYTRVQEIESKAVLDYSTTVLSKPIIQLISPPITLLGKTMDEHQPITNLDILKAWVVNYEQSKFLSKVFWFLLVGFIFQFLGSEILCN